MNKQGMFGRLRSAFQPSSLPPASFIFGVGNSDHQCEAYDPRYEDIRDVWDRRPGTTPRGRATDFWNRFAEDVGLAQQLGCKMFRFSIAWARVEPNPGQYNEEAFDHYARLIEAIRAAGMEPMVTLLHFVWPNHVQARGGMTSDDFPSIFARYATEVSRRFAEKVKYWITINEPNILAFGYIKPWWERSYFFPPGLPPEADLDDQMMAIGQLMRNLFLAHTAARAAIQQFNPGALVGANPSLLGLPTWLDRWINRHVTGLRNPQDLAGQGHRFTERALLEKGAVDIVAATFTENAARARQVDFSTVYYIAGQTLLVKASSAVAAPGDLAGQAVAVVKGSTAESGIRTLVPQADVRVVENPTSAVALLDQGRAAAVLSDDTILLGVMQLHPGQYRLVAGRMTDEPYAIAVAKGNTSFLNLVDATVQRFLQSGEWAARYAQHFPGQPVPVLANNSPSLVNPVTLPSKRDGAAHDRPPLAPKNTLLRRIQDRGYLIAAVKQDVPGFGYRDPATGAWSGLEIDLARAIARSIFADENKVVFRSTTAQQRIPLLQSILRFFDPIQKIYSIVSTALTTNWWNLGMAGKLPEFICPRECAGQLDFVGFDYYWGIDSLRLNRIQRLMDALMKGRYDNAPVWPGVLHDMLTSIASLLPHMPIVIVENGCVDVADGIDRGTYLGQHIREVQRAQRDGANVSAYICWSITTNREWGLALGRNSDFGLYHVDLDGDPELKRVPSDAVAIYRQIIEQHGVREPA